jgi:hypothetical protein
MFLTVLVICVSYLFFGFLTYFLPPYFVAKRLCNTVDDPVELEAKLKNLNRNWNCGNGLVYDRWTNNDEKVVILFGVVWPIFWIAVLCMGLFLFSKIMIRTIYYYFEKSDTISFNPVNLARKQSKLKAEKKPGQLTIINDERI